MIGFFNGPDPASCNGWKMKCNILWQCQQDVKIAMKWVYCNT